MALSLVVGYLDYLLARVDSSFALRSTVENIDLKIDHMGQATLTKQLALLNAYLQCHSLEPTVDFMRNLLIQQIETRLEAKRSKRTVRDIESSSQKLKMTQPGNKPTPSMLQNEYYEGLLDKIWSAYEKRHFKVKIASAKSKNQEIDNSQKIASIIKQKLDQDPLALEKAYKTFNEEEFKNDIRDFVDNISQDARAISPDLFCKKFRGFVSDRRYCFAERVLKEEMIMDFDKKERSKDFFKMLGFHAVMSKLERNLMKKYLIRAEPDGQFELLRKFDTINEVEDPETHELKTLYVPKSKTVKSRAKKMKKEEQEALFRKIYRPISRYIRNLDADKNSFKGHHGDSSRGPSSPRRSKQKSRESIRASIVVPKLKFLPSYETLDGYTISPERSIHNSISRPKSGHRISLRPSFSAHPSANTSAVRKGPTFRFGKTPHNQSREENKSTSNLGKSKSAYSIDGRIISPATKAREVLKKEANHLNIEKPSFKFVLMPTVKGIEPDDQKSAEKSVVKLDMKSDSKSELKSQEESSKPVTDEFYLMKPVSLRPALKQRSSMAVRPRPTSSRPVVIQRSGSGIINSTTKPRKTAELNLNVLPRTSIDTHFLAPPRSTLDGSMMETQLIPGSLFLPIPGQDSQGIDTNMAPVRSVQLPIASDSHTSVTSSIVSVRIKRHTEESKADSQPLRKDELKAKIQTLIKTCNKTCKQIKKQRTRTFRPDRLSRPIAPIAKSLAEIHQDYDSKDRVIQMIDRNNFKKKFVTFLADQVQDTNNFFYAVQVSQTRQRLREERINYDLMKNHLNILSHRVQLHSPQSEGNYSAGQGFNQIPTFESRPSKHSSPMRAIRFNEFDADLK